MKQNTKSALLKSSENAHTSYCLWTAEFVRVCRRCALPHTMALTSSHSLHSDIPIRTCFVEWMDGSYARPLNLFTEYPESAEDDDETYQKECRLVPLPSAGTVPTAPSPAPGPAQQPPPPAPGPSQQPPPPAAGPSQ